jgi:hypothetical protein
MTAAAQICRRIAFTSRLRVEEQNHHLKLKNVACSLSKAVLQFWHSVSNNCQSVGSKNGKHEVGMFVGNEFSVNKFGDIDKVLVMFETTVSFLVYLILEVVFSFTVCL